MAPTQRHSWFSATRQPERQTAGRPPVAGHRPGPAELRERYGTVTFGPVVALITAYEEERNIGDVLKAMPAFVGDLEVSTLVVVDGGSDGTARVALDSGAYTCVLPVNLGSGGRAPVGLCVGRRAGRSLCGDHRRRRPERPSRARGDGPTPDRRRGRLRDRLAPPRAWTRPLTDSGGPGSRSTHGPSTPSSGSGSPTRPAATGHSGSSCWTTSCPTSSRISTRRPRCIITSGRRGWRITERPTVWHPRASGTSKKGGNIFFGVQYAKVIVRTWLRTLPKSQPPA